MPISAELYERVALADREGRWELVCGRLVSRGPMTTEHADSLGALDRQLQRQVNESEFLVRPGTTKLRVSNGNYYLPDLCIIPIAMARRLRETPGTFEVYAEPVPFVAEVWSLSTGGYDLRTKLREYQLRDDREVWLIHPKERTVRVYRLQRENQAENRYNETLHQGGRIALAALPDVVVDIDRLFP